MGDYNFYGIPDADGNRYFAREKNYTTCDTAAATAAKTASLDGFVLQTGIAVRVKFTYTNTASSPTLNVEDTGAKAIKQYGTTDAGTTTKTSWRAGEVITFVYDGTNWLMADAGDKVYSAATQSAEGLMSPADKIKLDGQGLVRITIPALSAKTYTSADNITNLNKLTSDHELVNYWFGTPAAITSDINWTSGAGTLQVSGTITGTTNAVFIFGK